MKFLAKFTNSYTKFFNSRHQRVGPLFQGVFKAVHIQSGEQLVHLSRYIHLNPVTGFVIKIKELVDYPWSSYPCFISNKDDALTDRGDVMQFFKNETDYEKFITDYADYAVRQKMIEHLMID